MNICLRATPTILFLLIVGCTPALTRIPAESIYAYTDFTKYTKMGFLITPEKYDGEYESIGSVRYTYVPEAKFVAVRADRLSDGTTQYTKRWMTGTVNDAAGLDSLYTMARDMGANAIVNFKLIEVTRPYNQLVNPLTISGLEYSGYAIKRRDK